MGAEGILVEIRRTGSDRGLSAAARGLRRQALLGLVALPPLLYVLTIGVRGIVAAAKEEPVLEGIAIAIALVITAVIISREYRRQRRRPNLPDQRWCSPRPLVYPGPYDDIEGFVGSRAAADSGPVVLAWLVLTSSSIVIMPTTGDGPPISSSLADISTIGLTWAGRRDSGLTIARRDGRVARFLAKPDEKLVRELERLGATVTNADTVAT